MQLPRIFLFLFLTFSLSHSIWAAAQIVGTPSIQRNFLMDGDSEDPARDGVAVSMTAVIFTTSADPIEWAHYQVKWTLQTDESGSWTAVTLSDGTTTQLSDFITVELSYDTGDSLPSSELIEMTELSELSELNEMHETNERKDQTLNRTLMRLCPA